MHTDQQNIILRLGNKKSYPHKVSKIKILETHISWVILTGSYAYKVKKNVKFGQVLDFSKLYLRKKFCNKEISLNKTLCGNMYQKVVKIVNKNDIFKIVDLRDHGRAIEYAVKMIEIPQKFRMDNLLQDGKIDTKTVECLTKILIKFHNGATTSKNISRFGRPIFIKKKVNENFKTLSQLIKLDPIFQYKLESFVENNIDLFHQRIKENRIRDIHGDLYLKNIFIVRDKIYLYDRIEFNDSLRYADVIEDISHLAMDFDFHQRIDLRDRFISCYMKKSGDDVIKKMIFFMMCYKACVRGKVSLFRANEVLNNEKTIHEKEAMLHFNLAKSYIEHF